MPPLPSWETIAYGPSVVPGERVMGEGEYSAAGWRRDPASFRQPPTSFPQSHFRFRHSLSPDSPSNLACGKWG